MHGDNEDDGDDSITDVEFTYSLRCSSFLGFNQLCTQDPIKVAPKRNYNGDYRQGASGPGAEGAVMFQVFFFFFGGGGVASLNRVYFAAGTVGFQSVY